MTKIELVGHPLLSSSLYHHTFWVYSEADYHYFRCGCHLIYTWCHRLLTFVFLSHHISLLVYKQCSCFSTTYLGKCGCCGILSPASFFLLISSLVTTSWSHVITKLPWRLMGKSSFALKCLFMLGCNLPSSQLTNLSRVYSISDWGEKIMFTGNCKI